MSWFERCGASAEQVQSKCGAQFGSRAKRRRMCGAASSGNPLPKKNTSKNTPKSTKTSKKTEKTPNFFFRLPGCLRVPVRVRCGTAAAPVRHRCGNGAAPVRIACGRGAERVRNAGGTPTEHRRICGAASSGWPGALAWRNFSCFHAGRPA